MIPSLQICFRCKQEVPANADGSLTVHEYRQGRQCPETQGTGMLAATVGLYLDDTTPRRDTETYRIVSRNCRPSIRPIGLAAII